MNSTGYVVDAASVAQWDQFQAAAADIARYAHEMAATLHDYGFTRSEAVQLTAAILSTKP